ncbi:hypothetical protein [Actinomadura coerulea]|uniref:hypothetical protein n=1 Tax=Actinomadura coerulea TaxID=46159 RepID=UPI0034287931
MHIIALIPGPVTSACSCPGCSTCGGGGTVPGGGTCPACGGSRKCSHGGGRAVQARLIEAEA